MAYHNHAVDLDWPAPWRNPHGPEYGATHLTTPQNIVQHNPGMQNDYQLFAVTERQSEAGSQAPVDVPLTWKGRRDSYSTTIPSQTDDIAATDREQPRSFGGIKMGRVKDIRQEHRVLGLTTRYSETPIQQTGRFPTPPAKDTGANFLKTDWYHQFSRISTPIWNLIAHPGELGSLYAAVRATSIPNIEESDVISGQKRVDYSKTSDHPLLSDKTRDHVTSAVPAQVGRPITQAEVANSLASTTKSAKIGIRKLTRETGEQNLISRLEVKTKEGSRTHTVGIPPIEGQDIEIKRIIQEYQLDESGKRVKMQQMTKQGKQLKQNVARLNI
ncbi:hypothetical protein H4Q26_007408 [Puccinia striiformis f. sp. tritici PST-130]|nr:hypothetical protein H4Q26_007408 [Puccinia striiformis f. sp. tritici PST-130]